MGCGSCTAECPAKAITLRHFVDSQILGAMDGLLCGECETSTPELAYPAQSGLRRRVGNCRERGRGESCGSLQCLMKVSTDIPLSSNGQRWT